MKGNIFTILVAAAVLAACSTPEPPSGLRLNGYWITDSHNTAMLDPQTSGLVKWRDRLLSVSDASAHKSQRLRLVQISPDKAQLYPQSLEFEMSQRVQQSCFGDYLGNKPDFEALVVDPDNDNVLILVTEDATRSGNLSNECEQQYADTGSTDYPTLLVRLELTQANKLIMSHVRPLQFKPSFNVGNYPNDGIEGMAVGPGRTLYLGLEKDKDNQPRVFSILLDESFWMSEDFAKVEDPQLKTPIFESGHHPINAMSYYSPRQGSGYLVAVARNDEEIWFIDLDKKRNTIIVPVHFMAEINPSIADCTSWELMDNASLEGVAVDGDILWLVNDPWKRKYHNNIQCEVNRVNYEKMAPLLFKMNIDPKWFK